MWIAITAAAFFAGWWAKGTLRKYCTECLKRLPQQTGMCPECLEIWAGVSEAQWLAQTRVSPRTGQLGAIPDTVGEWR